jgi:hypothetical protein
LRLLLLAAALVLSSCASVPKEPRVVVRLVEERDLDSVLWVCERDARTKGLLCTDLDRFLLFNAAKPPGPGKQL